uniref:evolutionarily conserved signaling intermediate in Toll pathway, mitochondrial n=1 Tax=Ciona intestinalis TaxID=7719 RepID=UPI000180D2B4|nr:evolutionarily conserved signaling intermediate in Toll pathway, mitochondrial [Ciona intestinalis]|eukprot:XP_002128876.1 evolutionarily conserved signaling intermediate in Toll pathway, mitochondrial [Ciona intestinalis]
MNISNVLHRQAKFVTRFGKQAVKRHGPKSQNGAVPMKLLHIHCPDYSKSLVKTKNVEINFKNPRKEITRKEIDDCEEEQMINYYINKAKSSLNIVDDVDYYDIDLNKRTFYKLVDIWISEAGLARRGHREFIQAAMHAMPKFNVESDIRAYVRLLDCFPDGKHTGIHRSHWFYSAFQDKIADHSIAENLVSQISQHGAIPNDKLFNKALEIFGKFSPAMLAVRQCLFWYPRIIAFQKHPISVSDFKELSPTEIAFHGLRQMSPGLDAKFRNFEVLQSECDEILNTDQLDSVVSIQTPEQQSMLAKHDPDSPVFIQGPNTVYVKNKQLQYYVMRSDPKELIPAKKEVKTTMLTSKEWWQEFYGTDWETNKSYVEGKNYIFPDEEFFPRVELEDGLGYTETRIKEIAQVEKDTEKVEGPVYAIACTDYTSHAALRTWVRGLLEDNKNLSLCTVMFQEETPFLLSAPKTDPNDE